VIKINPLVKVHSKDGLHIRTVHEAQVRRMLAAGVATVKLKRRKVVMAIEIETIEAHIIGRPTRITLAALAGQRYTRRVAAPAGGFYQEFKPIDHLDRAIFCLSVTENLCPTPQQHL
jgi:hypothetical protein